MEEQIADFAQSDGRAVAHVQRELGVMRGVDRRQSADRTTPDTGRWTYDGLEGRLIAENTELARRIRRLSPALVSMARDLAAARRENGALRRKNGQLHARVKILDQTSAAPILEAALVTRGRPPERETGTGARLEVVIPVHCEGCGLTIHPGAMRRDLGYLVARSCPRCARPLSPPTKAAHESREAQGTRRKQLATRHIPRQLHP